MIVLASRDLIFATKVTGTTDQLGGSCRVVSDATELGTILRESAPRLVLIDLTSGDIATPEAIRSYRAAANENAEAQAPTFIAFGPHVEAEKLEAARQAGCDDAMPRSKFTRILPDLLKPHIDGA